MVDLKLTRAGSNVKYERVEISIALTPEQRRLISRVIGKNVEKLDLTANDLKMIFHPGPFEYKEWAWPAK